MCRNSIMNLFAPGRERRCVGDVTRIHSRRLAERRDRRAAERLRLAPHITPDCLETMRTECKTVYRRLHRSELLSIGDNSSGMKAVCTRHHR